jgi:hypothetical protein
VKPELLYSVAIGAPWDDHAAADLARAVDHSDAPAPVVAGAVEEFTGLPRVALCINGERVGTMVYEILSGCEFFICALAAERPGLDLLAAFCDPICNFARSLGCVSVKYSTSRPGMVKKPVSLGFRVAAVVMRKTL